MTSTPKAVLMISTKLDPHVDAVLTRLEACGVPTPITSTTSTGSR